MERGGKTFVFLQSSVLCICLDEDLNGVPFIRLEIRVWLGLQCVLGLADQLEEQQILLF